MITNVQVIQEKSKGVTLHKTFWLRPIKPGLYWFYTLESVKGKLEEDIQEAIAQDWISLPSNCSPNNIKSILKALHPEAIEIEWQTRMGLNGTFDAFEVIYR